MTNRFNLIDEPWIPVAAVGRVSLRQIFSNPAHRSLGGNPVQKIALMKLLLAIAQAAATPADEQAWSALSAQGLAEHSLAYLDRCHDRFYLYGERPFLQMPAIAAAAVQDYGAVMPEVSTGNTTVLSQIQVFRELDDAERAVLLVSLMAFALGGKKTDNSVVLSPGYQGKLNDKGNPSSSKHGPAVECEGLLHSFLLTDNLHQTLWLNLLTHEQIEKPNMFPQGLGTPPWEQMPEGEDCAVAQALKQSLLGRLVPLCRFCLLSDDGLHYSEGLAHSGYKEGIADPSVAINTSGKVPEALLVDPEKRPWRELTSLLGFFELNNTQGFQCWQIRSALERARDATEVFAIWSGGLRVSSNAGEQYASGKDDFVESLVWLHSEYLGEIWFAQLKAEMTALDDLAKGLERSAIAFFKEQKVDGSELAARATLSRSKSARSRSKSAPFRPGRELPARATHLFWQLCERNFQELLDGCEQDEQGKSTRLRRIFAAYVLQSYDQFCPKETARQLDAWAKCRPNNSKYLQQEA